MKNIGIKRRGEFFPLAALAGIVLLGFALRTALLATNRLHPDESL